MFRLIAGLCSGIIPGKVLGHIYGAGTEIRSAVCKGNAIPAIIMLWPLVKFL